MALGSLGRLAGNAVSLVTSDLVNRASTFVLYALVARNLGAHEFGQLSLALTYFYLAQVLAVAGLKTLITREVAKNRANTERYLVNGSLVVVVFSLLSITLLWLLVQAVGYSADTASVILVLSLGLIPYSLSVVCEAVFRAWERMHYIAVAQLLANVGKVALAFAVLAMGHGLPYLVLALLASHTAVLAIEWLMVSGRVGQLPLRIDIPFILAMARSMGAFLGIDGTIAIVSSVNVLLLSKLAGETQTGLYSAATQLLVPFLVLFQNTALSVFPIMCRRFDPSFQSLRRISEYLVEFLLALALPALIALFFLAAPALELLYEHSDFQMASDAVRIMAWNVVLVALTSALGQVLLASLREHTTLRIVVVDAIVSLVFGLILISQFGMVGAAMNVLLTRVVDFLQHYVAVTRLLPEMSLVRLAWRPAVAGGFMAAFLAVMGSRAGLLVAIPAVTLYAVALAILMVWSTGGPGQLKARYLEVRSE